MKIIEALNQVKEAFEEEYGVTPSIDIFIHVRETRRNKKEVETIIDGVANEMRSEPKHGRQDGDLCWSFTTGPHADVTAFYYTDIEEETNDNHQQAEPAEGVCGNGQQRI